jgi:hypothetical protein
MSDFIASLLMVLVFAGTWFTLFYVGGSSWLAEASVLRARYQTPGQAPALAPAPLAQAQASVRTATRPNASNVAQPARVTRLVLA